MKNFTVLHRLLHWILAISILATFVTGFLRIYWMGDDAISTAASNHNIIISEKNLGTITHFFQEPMFQWHVYFAYVITFVFIGRIIYMIVKGIKFPNPFSKTTVNKDKFQGLVYIAFYVLIASQIITGAIIKYDFGSDYFIETSVTIHKFAVYWTPIYILLHFAGIAISENTTKKGLASKMIGGDSN